jgi:hypothetical protein
MATPISGRLTSHLTSPLNFAPFRDLGDLAVDDVNAAVGRAASAASWVTSISVRPWSTMSPDAVIGS